MWSRWHLVLWWAVAAAALMTWDSRAQTTQQEKGSNWLYQDEGSKLEKSNRMWGQNDICGKDSFRKFPDYTAEAALKRDAYMRDCLRKNHLPPRNDLARPLKSGQ